MAKQIDPKISQEAWDEAKELVELAIYKYTQSELTDQEIIDAKLPTQHPGIPAPTSAEDKASLSSCRAQLDGDVQQTVKNIWAKEDIRRNPAALAQDVEKALDRLVVFDQASDKTMGYGPTIHALNRAADAFFKALGLDRAKLISQQKQP